MANARYGFRFSHKIGGGFPAIETGTADTDVTLAIGDAVIRGSDGYINIALSTSETILGVACNAVTATSGVRPDVMYIPATPENVFKIETKTGTAFAITHKGNDYSLSGSTGAMVLDLSDTDPGVFQIIDMVLEESVGSCALVYGIFKDSQFTGQT